MLDHELDCAMQDLKGTLQWMLRKAETEAQKDRIRDIWRETRDAAFRGEMTPEKVQEITGYADWLA